jgi:hypothetical protein
VPKSYSKPGKRLAPKPPPTVHTVHVAPIVQKMETPPAHLVLPSPNAISHKYQKEVLLPPVEVEAHIMAHDAQHPPLPLEATGPHTSKMQTSLNPASSADTPIYPLAPRPVPSRAALFHHHINHNSPAALSIARNRIPTYPGTRTST